MGANMTSYDLVYHCAVCNQWSEVRVEIDAARLPRGWKQVKMPCAHCGEQPPIALMSNESVAGQPIRHVGSI